MTMQPATAQKGAFTVLVTLKVPAERQKDILQLARQNLPIFARQPGFLFAEILCSQDQTRVLTCLHWESEADHHACMLSPDWAEGDPEFFELLEQGTVKMEVRAYDPVCIQVPANV